MTNQTRGLSTIQTLACSRSPSREVSEACRTLASAAKVPHRSQYLQRLAFRLEQRRSVRPQTAERITPLCRSGGSVGVQPVSRRVEHDRLALDFLDHGAPREHLLQRVSRGQASAPELEATQLGKRIVVVSEDDTNSVLRAQVTQEQCEHQHVGLVPARLQESCPGNVRAFGVSRVAQVLHLEQAG